MTDIEEKTEIDWKNLTGLLSKELPISFAQYDDFKVSYIDNVVVINGKTSNFNVRLRCNLESKVIYAAMFEIYIPKNHYGLIAFKEHVKKGQMLDFLKIECRASSELKSETEKYNGHYTWCVFGFSMNKESRDEFLNRMIDAKRQEKSLSELLSSEDGKICWEEKNFTWDAEFFLKPPDSDNINILKEYCKRVQIKF